MRFTWLVCLFAAVACVTAGGASALDFNDEGDNAPIGEVGKIYHFEMPAHGGCDTQPYRFVVESGILPPGLKIGNAPHQNLVGLVEGIPTESGTFPAWIALKDICGNSAELLFTFEIWVRRWGITTASLPGATVGSPYRIEFTGQGVSSKVFWKVSEGTLPAGLTLQEDGVLFGTPTGTGASTFKITATAVATDPSAEGTRVDTKQYTLNVTQALGATVSRQRGEVGVRFRGTLSGTGGQAPYSWAATGLPPGLTVDASGSISGTPTRAGSYPAQITLTDANRNFKVLNVRFTVAQRLAFATKLLPRATVGASYRIRLAVRGGFRPVLFTIVRGHLPPDLKLNARTGTIAGVARAAGSGRVVVRARDAAGGTATKAFVVTASG